MLPLCSRFERDRVDVPAVVRLLAMHRAAIAEEALVGVGVETKVVDHQDAGGLQPRPDEAGEVEHRMAGTICGNEIRGVAGIVVEVCEHHGPQPGLRRLYCSGCDDDETGMPPGWPCSTWTMIAQEVGE